jgi:hypothetical protein
MHCLLARLKERELSAYEIRQSLLIIEEWLGSKYPVLGALYTTEILKKVLPLLEEELIQVRFTSLKQIPLDVPGYPKVIQIVKSFKQSVAI